mmetsp:Transcript_631/g.1827  ORF Transcript_631/g.1827 Transcript_631/m.1827 type:complete len:548 (-) Transcript_631:169-1812(-)
MLAHGVLALLLAPLGVTAHFTGEVSSRRLQSWQEKVEHIWSSCDNWDRTWSTCDGTNLKCSDNESPGPVDADVEIRLGGLHPSTSEEDVYLQWWAPRKSPTEYKLLESPVNASIYLNIDDAYPKYYDGAFNGGNVRITESGEAVITVHAPAMYFVWQCLALPHIHMRTCRGDSFSLRFLDGIFFGLSESWVLTGSTESDAHIVSSRALSPARASPSLPGSPGPEPVAIVTRVWRIDRGTTTLAEATTSLTTTSTITTSSLKSLTDVGISAARDQLQLDALEFSPVYSCFRSDQFFDHFSAECTESCPADAAMEHGQCVREELDIPAVTFDATWKLQVRCGVRCWHDKTNETFHGIRLSMAGHFDIPFQEVEHVSLGFESTVEGRRLEGTIQVALMRVRVETRRHSEDSGGALMDNFLPSAAIASQLLGVPVQGVELLDAPVDVINSTSMTWDNDPYTPAYEAIEKNPVGSSLGGLPSDFLPPEAIIGIAGGIMVIGAVVGVLAVWRRRVAKQKAEQAREAAKVKDVDSEAAGESPNLKKGEAATTAI